MYTKKTWIYKNIIEVEKGFSVRVGDHSGHAKKEKPTPEDVKKYNLNQSAKKLARKIAANFGAGDYHLVLTYQKDLRLPEPESRKELNNFLSKLRRRYKKVGAELKYIVTTEWRRTAIHHHVILNRVDGTEKAVRECWARGRPKFTMLDDSGNYTKLAEYFVKETGAEKLNNREKGKQCYSCSRNLIIPKPKVERISARDFKEDPKPLKGYYIVKDTLVNGISKFGYKYQRYIMARIGGKHEQSYFNGEINQRTRNKVQQRRTARGDRKIHTGSKQNI